MVPESKRQFIIPYDPSLKEYALYVSAKMEYFSMQPNVDAVNILLKEIKDTKQIITKNIELLLMREEKLKILVTKTEKMS